jgi:hypothetical protein
MEKKKKPMSEGLSTFDQADGSKRMIQSFFLISNTG